MSPEERAGERLSALFVLGVVLFSPLVMRIFDVGSERMLFGIPLLYFYTFCAWALLIVLMAVTVRRGYQSESVDAANPRDLPQDADWGP